MIATVIDPPDVAAGHDPGRQVLRHSLIEYLAQFGVVLSRFIKFGFQVLPEPPGKVKAQPVKFQGIPPQVPQVAGGIDSPGRAAEGILVGAEAQGRFRRPPGDTPQHLRLADIRLRVVGGIGVFDRPVVVRPQGGLEILRRGLPLRRQVSRQVIHDRPAQPMLRPEVAVAQLRRVVSAAGLEIMAQAQGMPHLVGHDIHQRLVNKALKIFAVSTLIQCQPLLPEGNLVRHPGIIAAQKGGCSLSGSRQRMQPAGQHVRQRSGRPTAGLDKFAELKITGPQSVGADADVGIIDLAG